MVVYRLLPPSAEYMTSQGPTWVRKQESPTSKIFPYTETLIKHKIFQYMAVLLEFLLKSDVNPQSKRIGVQPGIHFSDLPGPDSERTDLWQLPILVSVVGRGKQHQEMPLLLLFCVASLLPLSFCHSCFLAEEAEGSKFFKVSSQINSWPGRYQCPRQADS